MQAQLSVALEHHRRGALSEAAWHYRTILADRPAHADANHLLGVVALQQGEPRCAAELIGRAIALEPGCATYHGNLAEAYRLLERPDRAIAAGRTALRLQPDFPEAANVLGLTHLARGQVDEAIHQFQEAIRLRPGFALAHNNLGNAWLARDDKQQALAAFHRAVELEPGLVEARSNLGQLLLEEGKVQEAIDQCREAVRLRPNFAEGLCNLGNALRQRGELNEAKRCYAEALRLAPDIAMVHNNLGQALQEEGSLDEAVACYLTALQIEPDSARFHANLASALVDQEKPDEAAARFETTISLDPDFAPAHNGLGAVRRDQGRYEEARTCFERALEIDPDLTGSRCALGGIFEEQGDFEAARACFREALRRDPKNAAALGHSATLEKGELPEEDLAAMTELLRDPELRDGARVTLHFGLAQVLDARGEFAAAALHLEQANQLDLADRRRHGRSYEPSRHALLVNALLAICTPEFFERARDFGSQSERPVFIVGLPRSGTTLTEQILSSHSQVHGAGELTLAPSAFEALPASLGPDGTPAECLGRLEASTARRLAEAHLERLAKLDATAERVVDKLPDNYLYMGMLAAIFPKARFIHCRRDLRDVAVSCWMTNFAQIRWANDPAHIADRFRQYVRLTDHWRRVLPVPVLEVHYEDLVRNLEGEARRLVNWCGLEWEPACRAFHETRRPVRTASVSQVRQPIYTRSVARWKHYEPALASLFADLPGEQERAGAEGSRLS